MEWDTRSQHVALTIDGIRPTWQHYNALYNPKSQANKFSVQSTTRCANQLQMQMHICGVGTVAIILQHSRLSMVFYKDPMPVARLQTDSHDMMFTYQSMSNGTFGWMCVNSASEWISDSTAVAPSHQGL